MRGARTASSVTVIAGVAAVVAGALGGCAPRPRGEAEPARAGVPVPVPLPDAAGDAPAVVAAMPDGAAEAPRDAAPAASAVDAAAPRADARAPSPDTAGDLPPCVRACTRMYTCLAVDEQPIYARCVATCDGRRTAELDELAQAPCAELDRRLAAGAAPITRRDCAAMIAPHHPTRAGDRRATLLAHPWCAADPGPLDRTPLHFEPGGRLWWASGQACWYLAGDRLAWSADDVRWTSVRVRWPRRADEPVRAGAQRLGRCPEPAPLPPPADPPP